MSPRPRTPFVFVTGGKGGVGKSTIALNLAIQLARSGARTLLCDLDLGLANQSVLLRLSPERDVEDLLAGRATLAECLIDGPAGLAVLPASSGTPAMARPDDGRRQRLLASLEVADEPFDVIVGDSAAGIGPDVLAFGTHARQVLVVTTPEPTALTDAYGTYKALDAWSLEQGLEVPTPELFLNLVADAREANAIEARFRATCERFLARSPRLAGWLPRSARIADSCRKQRPFTLGAGGGLERGTLQKLARRVLAQAGRPRAALTGSGS